MFQEAIAKNEYRRGIQLSRAIVVCWDDFRAATAATNANNPTFTGGGNGNNCTTLWPG